MGGFIGTITDAVGLTNHKAEEQAAQNAAQASADASALAADNLEFQKAQYQDWKNIYGDIAENLGSYYENLGSERAVALGLQAVNKEYQQAAANMKQQFAQSGLSDSKFAQSEMDKLGFSQAQARAAARVQGDETARTEQLNFLGLGLGQGTNMLGMVNLAANTGVQAATSTANMYNSQFTTHADNNAQMMRQLVDSGTTAAGYAWGQS